MRNDISVSSRLVYDVTFASPKRIASIMLKFEPVIVISSPMAALSGAEFTTTKLS